MAAACQYAVNGISEFVALLVLPAASKPSINNRISLDPKTLLSNLEIFWPMAANQLLKQLRSRCETRICGGEGCQDDWESCTALSQKSRNGALSSS